MISNQLGIQIQSWIIEQISKADQTLICTVFNPPHWVISGLKNRVQCGKTTAGGQDQLQNTHHADVLSTRTPSWPQDRPEALPRMFHTSVRRSPLWEAQRQLDHLEQRPRRACLDSLHIGNIGGMLPHYDQVEDNLCFLVKDAKSQHIWWRIILHLRQVLRTLGLCAKSGEKEQEEEEQQQQQQWNKQAISCS